MFDAILTDFAADMANHAKVIGRKRPQRRSGAAA